MPEITIDVSTSDIAELVQQHIRTGVQIHQMISEAIFLRNEFVNQIKRMKSEVSVQQAIHAINLVVFFQDQNGRDIKKAHLANKFTRLVAEGHREPGE